MSQNLAGVTFLAFGNGSPDVFSTFAAMNSHSGSLAIGELIGAAGFITAVVSGSMALVREFKVGKKTFVRDVGFFIVAASFSMLFLADGALHLWECCVMIGFYLFYVFVVVAWHYYLGNRRKLREREAAARGHYLAVTNEEVEAANQDMDDEEAPTGRRTSLPVEDFAMLERGLSADFDDDVESDGDGDAGMSLQAEMASSMRVTRPAGVRRGTYTPIRPSLVGALEFRSVLSTLQNARNSLGPIHLRRYSDDPTANGSSTNLLQLDGPSYNPGQYHDDPGLVLTEPEGTSGSPPRTDGSLRTRAVSMNDVDDSRKLNPAAFSVANVPDIGLVAATPTFPRFLHVPGDGAGNSIVRSPSPSLTVTPPTSNHGGSRDVSPAPGHERRAYGTVAADDVPGARHLRVDYFQNHDRPSGSDAVSSRTSRTIPVQRPRIHIPGISRDSSPLRSTSPIIRFPAYTDSPLPISSHGSKAPSIMMLPDPAYSPESCDDCINSIEHSPISWWPYRWLPSPHVLACTLFPTLCTWSDKSIWDKCVSIFTAPSIFLLAITLPVVEPEVEAEIKETPPVPERRHSSHTTTRRRSSTMPPLAPDSPSLEEPEPEWITYKRVTHKRNNSHTFSVNSPLRAFGDRHEFHSPAGTGTSSPTIRILGEQHVGSAFAEHSTAHVAVGAEIQHEDQYHPGHIHSPTEHHISKQSLGPTGPHDSPAGDWNRWLVSLQIFTAPLFVFLITWANTEERDPRFLLQLILYSTLGSLICYALLVLTTTPDRPPKYRFILCFMGFIVSIAWISTIANEVVGVLKTFGVVLGISDAILGLTIFAVGNSLGDLVADITVARLGYPVMALSACFGGPMLNILLGVGLSGMYMTIKEANHKHEKHPGKAIKYKPYQIEVSGTLLVSGISLLITLVGLLIVVPMNKWVMDRRIGWGLIILWCISTVLNLTVEYSGVWGDTA